MLNAEAASDRLVRGRGESSSQFSYGSLSYFAPGMGEGGGGGRRWGTPRKIGLGRVCGPLPKILTLFMISIYNIHYPF